MVATAISSVATTPTQALDSLSPQAKSSGTTKVKDADEQSQESAPPTPAQIQEAATLLRQAVSMVNTSVNFRVDQSTAKTVITVIDTERGQVIRQIPSEEALALSRAINVQQGLLLKTKT